MKTKIMSFVLAVVMILLMMPFAVSAAEVPTVLDLTFEGEITTKMTVNQVNNMLITSKNLSASIDSHCYLGTTSTYNRLYVKNGSQWLKADTASYIDASVAYYAAIEIYTNSGYEFADLNKIKAGDFTGFTITINGNVIPLDNFGTTHDILYSWSVRNFVILIPLTLFNEIEEVQWIQSITVSHDQKSVQKGTSFQFNATVLAHGGASDDVIWTIRDAVNSKDTTISENGLLTIGADETVSYTHIRCKAAANENIYEDIYISIINNAPEITSVEFKKESIDVFVDDYSYDTSLVVSGSEIDKRVTFVLSGGTKEGTKINNIYSDYVAFSTDPNETAETLTLTATSVADPTKFDTLIINVHQRTKFGDDFYLNLDYDNINFDPTMTEGELQDIVENSLSVDTENSTEFYIDDIRINFSQATGSGTQGIGDGTNKVNPAKDYMLSVDFYLNKAYEWNDEIILRDFSGITVYINGVACKTKSISFNEYWGFVEMVIIPNWFDADFTGANLSLGADLSMNYFVKIYDTENLSINKTAVQFTINERTILVKDYTIDGDEYVFTLKGIAPQEARDNITASIVELNDDGNTIKKVIKTKDQYSVSDNIYALYTSYSSDADMMSLLVDLIWYCECAQRYLNYSPNGSIRQYISTLAGVEMPAYNPVAEDNIFALDNTLTEGSRISAAGVRFSSDNKIYVKVTAEEKVTLVVKKAGEVVDTVEFEAGVHTYYTAGILATEFDVAYTFELTIGEEVTPTQTLTYSVNSYAIRTATMTEFGAPTLMANLARALYNYGKACEAYATAH